MALDIFSAFDDNNKNSFSALWCLLWLMPVLAAIKITSKSYMGKASINIIYTAGFCVNTGLNLLSNLSKLKGHNLLTAVFFFTVLMSTFSLTPYIFTPNAHLSLTLSLSLPIWLAFVVLGFSSKPKSFMAHLSPMGAPIMLLPFLCLVELVSLCMRPMTLAVRMTANLSTGHILLSLMAMMFSSVMPIFLLGMFYLIFEWAVCVIQTYIFVLLSIMYVDEHPL